MDSNISIKKQTNTIVNLNSQVNDFGLCYREGCKNPAAS